MKYSDERREAILKNLLPPHNRTVAEVAQEEGISVATLYNWRKKARQAGRLLPDQSDDPEGWSSQDKFHAVLETAALSEAERAEYCRQRGLHPEQIQRWRASCEGANDRSEVASKQQNEARKADRQENKDLMSCAARRPLSRKPQPSWRYEKRPERSGGTRTNDQHFRSPGRRPGLPRGLELSMTKYRGAQCGRACL